MLVIILKWLPWSGKSTRALQQEWFLIISKDIIRKSHQAALNQYFTSNGII